MNKSLSFQRLCVVIAFCATLIGVHLRSAHAHNHVAYSKAKSSFCFSGIYAFGDSLSDNGNLFKATGQPPAPYFEGRVSNGPVWVEYLAQTLRIKEDDVVNYAFAGATTGRDNFYDIEGLVDLPGLQDQLDFFEIDLQGGQADPEALYVVFAGANDFFLNPPTPEVIGTAIQNIVYAVQRLHFAGAKHILVAGLPELGRTPFGRATDPAGLSLLTAIFNSNLSGALDELASFGIETIRLDVVDILTEIEANPTRYGFTNVTDSYLESGEGDPNRYLYWDSVHPTTRGHRIISKEATRVLIKYKVKLLLQRFRSLFLQ